MFRNIIVAVDGSEPAYHALDVACDLAGKYGSTLHLVHSPQLETTAIAVGSGAVEIEASARKIAEAGEKVMKAATDRAQKQGCKPARCVIGKHDPVKDILDEVRSSSADLVVMGRRGLGRISSMVLGSVSQKVAHEAKCSCLTVS